MWFYAEGDQQQGPMSLEPLATTIAVQPEPEAVLVWREGLEAWTRAGDIPELAEQLAQVPVWHLTEDGASRGPLSLDELLAALIKLPEPREAVVWRGGLDTWKRAADLPELAEELPPPVPVAVSVPQDQPDPLAVRRLADPNATLPPGGSAVLTVDELDLEKKADAPQPPAADVIAEPAPGPRPRRLRARRRKAWTVHRLLIAAAALFVAYALVVRFSSEPGSPAPTDTIPQEELTDEMPLDVEEFAEAPKDPKGYQQACNAGVAAACTNLGTAHYYGDGVPVDVPRAQLLLRQGCDGGSAWGCYNLAVIIEAESEVPSGTEIPGLQQLYERACQIGHTQACLVVSSRY